jgi:hypothetical protein
MTVGNVIKINGEEMIRVHGANCSVPVSEDGKFIVAVNGDAQTGALSKADAEAEAEAYAESYSGVEIIEIEAQRGTLAK